MSVVGAGWENSCDDEKSGENVSDEERLMGLGSSGCVYVLLKAQVFLFSLQ